MKEGHSQGEKNKSWVFVVLFILIILVIAIIIVYATNNTIKNDKSPCEINNYSCYGSCPSDYAEIDIACNTGICCKKIPEKDNHSLIHGFVKLKQGNCMPPIDTRLCLENPITTQIAVFPRTSANQVIQGHYRPIIGPIKMTVSNVNNILGYYEIELNPGQYSIFVKDSKANNDFYCNIFDESGCACCVNIPESKEFNITIDHSTQ